MHSSHVALGRDSFNDVGSAKWDPRLTPVRAAKPGEKVCRGCHTPQRSPKFNFARYKAKIKHW